ncbi:unnamed protein product [Paramecium octaurelia]|uniref:Uncharacterized protein n=1 Tax=Paramecium octaurelia TaxID=43137 RepID=A0A8S1XMS6_PAROT|nr:unnamed protein product [Paramecium octaurelia]
MSITASTCQQINQSPLNLSTAKQLWSFPKSSRFGKLENPNNCAVAFYDLPDQKQKRAAGVGYSTKYDFTKNGPNTPAPDTYKIVGEIDFNKTKNRGYPFGVSRDKMWQTGIMGGLNKVTPGPGKYESQSTLSQTRYTMRPKNQQDIMILTKNVPGPGAYNSVQGIDSKGRYPISKFSNSCATLFNPPRSKRFDNKQYSSDVPGPGNYKLDNIGIQKTGFYPTSNLHSSKCRSFPHDIRKTYSVSSMQTPGPGQYRLPSDFGYYESKSKSISRS